MIRNRILLLLNALVSVNVGFGVGQALTDHPKRAICFLGFAIAFLLIRQFTQETKDL